MRPKLLCCCLIFITSFNLNAQIKKDTLWLSVHIDMEKLLFENMLPVWYPKVLDIENNFIRFADLTKVRPSLSKYRVIFESNARVEDSDKTN